MIRGITICLCVVMFAVGILLGELFRGGLGLGLILGAFLCVIPLCTHIIVSRINALEEKLMSALKIKSSGEEPSADTENSAAEDNNNGEEQA